MKKIMFNDKCGLTQAVLEGRKTMTRRIAPYSPFDEFMNTDPTSLLDKSRYKIGEVVSVAQSYNDIYEELKRTHGSSSSVTRDFFRKYIQGGRMPVSNKMFVNSDAILHQIRITDIKVERLQDISDEDCIKEGVDRNWGYRFKTSNGECVRHSAKEAFAVLIDKVSGKGTWERNPWVFAYTFELVK